MYTGLHAKYPSFLPDLNQPWSLSTEFPKILNIKFLKNLSAGVESLHAEAQTDRQIWQLMVAFRNFANTPTNFRTLLVDRADPLASQCGCFKGKPPLCNACLFISPVKYADFKAFRMWPSRRFGIYKVLLPFFRNTTAIALVEQWEYFCLSKISLPRALRLMFDTKPKGPSEPQLRLP